MDEPQTQEWTLAVILRVGLLFLLAGLAEIGGGWLVWGALRAGKPWWWAACGSGELSDFTGAWAAGGSDLGDCAKFRGLRGFSTFDVSDLTDIQYQGETVNLKAWLGHTTMGYAFDTVWEHNIEVNYVDEQCYLVKSSYADGVTVWD